MRVATWNVNGLRARLEFVLLWLRDRKPDVVGLQELKLSDDKFPHDVFEAEGYYAVVHGQKSWNGVAVLCREPASLYQAGLPGQEEFGARLVSADVEGLRFTTAYCPNGKNLEHDDYSRKLVWFDALATYLSERHDPEGAEILCGDFNICPTALDSWNESAHVGDIFHTDEERKRLKAIFGWGVADLFREKYPDEAAFSWWDYRGGAFHRKQGLRIDFLLATPAVRARCREVFIDRDYRKKKEGLTASDHAPVIADLD